MASILEMRGITKRFPGVKALDQVALDVEAGEIHALVGENGAGKSTLMKVLSGVYPSGSFEGELHLAGRRVDFDSIKDSEAEGVIIIHQELALVPGLSIAENIFLGNEVASGGVINWPACYERTAELLKKVGLREKPTTAVGKLGVGKQQLVEIAKALSKQVKLLILDEPTAALQENDSEKLLQLMLELKAEGITSILISHKLNEIRQVADRITVLRDGATVGTLDCGTEEISEALIISQMVGRDMAQRYPDRSVELGGDLFEVQEWNVWHPDDPDRQVIKDLNLQLKKGEVVGIAGLMGAGRTELAMSLFGRSYGGKTTGRTLLKGEPIDTRTVAAAIEAGVAYLTEDRKELGLVLDESILFNTSLANLDGVSARGVINGAKEQQVAERYRKALAIRTPSVQQKTVNLSGGNQQKVVLAKWLFAAPEVLILDEPTRGIDVGAKYEIYAIINQLAQEGKGIVMISSEMPELLGMCDRIYVMNEGEFVAELDASEASQELIMSKIVQGKASSRTEDSQHV